MSPSAQPVILFISFLLVLYIPVTLISFRNTRDMSRACQIAFSVSVFPVFIAMLVFSLFTMHSLFPSLMAWYYELRATSGGGSTGAAAAGGILVLPISFAGIYLWYRVFCWFGGDKKA